MDWFEQLAIRPFVATSATTVIGPFQPIGLAFGMSVISPQHQPRKAASSLVRQRSRRLISGKSA